MPSPLHKRGDVYWGNLDPQKGSEQAGRRPVVVLQNNLLNRVGNTVVVVPLTHTTRFAHLPCCLLVPKGDCDLTADRDAVALCHQIRVLDKRGLGAYITTLPSPIMTLLEDRVRYTLDL